MVNLNTSDVGILLPQPFVLRVGGEELRMQALPVKRLLGVVQYIQNNKDLLDKLQAMLGEAGAEDAKSFDIVGFLDGEVYRRLNGLVRLLYDKATAEKMTDEWCGEHMSNAHYAVILKNAIRQNQLDTLFQMAKEFMGRKFGEFLRQRMEQQRETVPGAEQAT